MKLELKDSPKKGEVACAKNNYDVGIYMFSKFTQHDEEIAATNKTKYYTIIEDNPVPSIEKIYEEYRDSDIFEGCDIPEVLHFIYFIKHRNMHGKTLKDFQNGVETNKVQPKRKALTKNGEWLEY